MVREALSIGEGCDCGENLLLGPLSSDSQVGPQG
jgi:hypothetical protein